MTKRFITVHKLIDLPLHNLNRDESGQPKNTIYGGVTRGRLSSQSMKHAARLAFLETQAGNEQSLRARDWEHLLNEIMTEIVANDPQLDVSAETIAQLADIGQNVAVRGLYSSKPSKPSKPKKATSDTDEVTPTGDEAKDAVMLLSMEEINALATGLLKESQKDSSFMESVRAAEETYLKTLFTKLVEQDPDHPLDATSTMLDIAAFGRMFAAQSNIQTHAAIAVSHAVGTHQMKTTLDFFTAVDELNNSGSAHMGYQSLTSGMYYQTFTIDVNQLVRSWRGAFVEGKLTPKAEGQLRTLTRALIQKLPGGKNNSTNSHVLPCFVLAEQQATPVAYSFSDPVQPGENGGYAEGSLQHLASEWSSAHAIDGIIFGNAITTPTPAAAFEGADTGDTDKILDFIVASVNAVAEVSQ